VKVFFKDELEYCSALVDLNHKNHDKATKTIFLPRKEMRPDMIYFKQIEMKWYALVIAVRVYNSGDPIPIEHNKNGSHNDNVASTDLKNVYTKKKNSDEINKQYSNYCKSFHSIFKNAFLERNQAFGGLLRLHIELPWVATSKSEITIPETSTTKLTNTTTDINVFIDRHNVSQFFSDNTIEYLQETTKDNFKIDRDVKKLQSYAIDSNKRENSEKKRVAIPR